MNCSFAWMNYLGHAYLSYNDPELTVGNMISDFVKGTSRLGFSGKIALGIQLHRSIDGFTDQHPATRRAMEIFRPDYRLYSGPITDIIWDYYLANDESLFTPESLKNFSTQTYSFLSTYLSSLPPHFQQLFPYMRDMDWLYNYRTKEGIFRSLSGLVRRSSFLGEIDVAYNLFLQNDVLLKECFDEFFPDVKQFAKTQIISLS